jgi:KUP system potassium uptake protein
MTGSPQAPDPSSQGAGSLPDPHTPDAYAPAAHGHGKEKFWALAVGAAGVVYGDIGTSPIYAFRESLHGAMKDGTLARAEVVGVISLMLWALIFVVTIKYAIFIMRADNKGEGGVLALMALAQHAIGRRTRTVFVLGVAGAALFYGDAILTPAVSVLSAVEGLKLAIPGFDKGYVQPVAIGILIVLFAAQARGTGKVGLVFGPLMVIWFLVLAAMGLMHISDDPGILAAFNPAHAFGFLTSHGATSFLVLGSVFLCVTGAEALYADMGHFGKGPIRVTWLSFVLPCLALNYLGQGAMVLAHPERATDPFFLMAPDWGLLPLSILTMAATIVASQAVITGAFSLTQQAIQLGLLPRLEIRFTNEDQRGQVYLPQINWLLLVGVLALVLVFGTSSSLASAYGIAVTGTMLVDSFLIFVVMTNLWKFKPWMALAIVTPFIIVDSAFFGANLLKVMSGGWFPLLLGAFLLFTMLTWVRGSAILMEKTRRNSVPMVDLIESLKVGPPARVKGTAVFLTSDLSSAPMAMMHNLKHNKVLHERNVILQVFTADTPRVAEENRAVIRQLSDDFVAVELYFGFMESPNVPRVLGLLRKKAGGPKFDIMNTSFFLGRRTVLPSQKGGMPLWQDKLYVALARSSANATDFYHIPSGRAVELGAQIVV